MSNSDLLSLPVDFDLIAGKVSIPGTTPGPSILQPNLASQADAAAGVADSVTILPVKLRDKFPWLIGLVGREGTLGEATLTELNVGVKEFAGETLYALNSGTDFVEVATTDGTRYRTIVYLDPDLLANVLSNYEDDLGTYLEALCEIEAVVEEVLSVSSELESESVLVVGSYDETHVLSFALGLGTSETGNYRITVALSLPNATRAALVSMTSTITSVDITEGSPYTIGTETGDLDVTAGGGGYPPNYKVTIAGTVSGTATGIDVSVDLDASDLTYSVIEFSLAGTGLITSGEQFYAEEEDPGPVTVTVKDDMDATIHTFTIGTSGSGADATTVTAMLSELDGIGGDPTSGFEALGGLPGGNYKLIRFYYVTDADVGYPLGSQDAPAFAKLVVDSNETTFSESNYPQSGTLSVTVERLDSDESYEEVTTELRKSTQSFVLRIVDDLQP